MGIEFEIKYRATPEIQAEISKTGTWHTISMETTYYDTPTKGLSRRHFTLRRRLENGTSICTLKAPAGALARGEWETECGSIAEAVPTLCKLGCPEILPALVAEGLVEACGARFTRRAATVEQDGAVLEIALDRGYLFAGEKQIPLCEVEVELKEGSQAAAVACAKALAETYGLVSEPASKFRRALALREDA